MNTQDQETVRLTDDWRDFRSAPRDGTWFEAKNAHEWRVVRYDDKWDRLPIGKPGKMWNDVPTHWRPLTPAGRSALKDGETS